MMIRNRIKELRHVLASDLRANSRNYRKHPPRQKALLKQLLFEVGYADALIAYESQGELILIDGHLRAETTPDQTVPVLVLDVTEQEAKKLLLTLDPLAAMAETDAAILGDLLKVTETSGEVDAWLKERAAPDFLDAPPVPKDERSGSSPWDRVNPSDGTRFLLGTCEATVPAALSEQFAAAVDKIKDAHPTYRSAIISVLEACFENLDS